MILVFFISVIITQLKSYFASWSAQFYFYSLQPLIDLFNSSFTSHGTVMRWEQEHDYLGKSIFLLYFCSCLTKSVIWTCFVVADLSNWFQCLYREYFFRPVHGLYQVESGQNIINFCLRIIYHTDLSLHFFFISNPNFDRPSLRFSKIRLTWSATAEPQILYFAQFFFTSAYNRQKTLATS